MKTYIKRLFDILKLICNFQIFNDISEMLNRYTETFKTLSLDFRCSEKNRKEVLVSVVVPTRNEAEKIPILLKSLKQSHHKNLEILVADYMSSDGTPRIARSFGARVIEVDKPGVGYASFLAVNELGGT